MKAQIQEIIVIVGTLAALVVMLTIAGYLAKGDSLAGLLIFIGEFAICAAFVLANRKK